MMSSRGAYLQRLPSFGLPPDIGQVEVVPGC